MRLASMAAEAPGGVLVGEPPAVPGAGTPTDSVPLQRDAADVAPAAGTPVVEAPTEPAGSVATPSAAVDEGMSQEEVDELAKRLVGPIVRRIKADMLLDRERRGLRIDAN